jgi:hypothetical protein
VLDGVGGRLADGRRDLGGAALGQDHAGGADALRRPADRAQVLRVGDLVERDQDGLGRREQVRGVGIAVRLDVCADAPVGVGAAAPPPVAQTVRTRRRPRIACRTALRP